MASQSHYILFKGKEAVLKAYDFNNVPSWALYVGKDPMFSYAGKDMTEGGNQLGDVIDALCENEMTGTLQLRIYREVPKGGIVNNTPYSYAFRFQLYGDEEYGQHRPQGLAIKQMREEIQQLKLLIENPPEEEYEEEDTTIMGRIGSYFKAHPDLERMILQGVIGFVKSKFGNINATPAAMAGTGTMNTGTQQPGEPTMAEAYNRLAPEEAQKFNQATYFLMLNDPKVGTNLLRLATLLQQNPGMYDNLTKMSF